MNIFVAYYRVSTDKQGKSDLDAKRDAVTVFVNGRGALRAEHTEVESGQKNGRPQLLEALATCRHHKATPLIVRLDHLRAMWPLFRI